MDEIAKRCKRKATKTQLGYWNWKPVYLQALLYVEDILLIADSEEKLKNCLTECGEEVTSKEMTLNVKKSNVHCKRWKPKPEIGYQI